jgi:uncharacterized protein (DUF885 family)
MQFWNERFSQNIIIYKMLSFVECLMAINLDDDMRMYPAVNDGMPALLHSNGRRLGKV